MVSVGDIIRKRYVATGVAVGRPLRTAGDDAPRVSLSNRTVAEDASVNDVIGALSVANGSGSYTFSITADPDSKFNISGANLRVDAALDYETATFHSVTIEADNGVDDPISQVFTINVTNVIDDAGAPAIVSLFPADNAVGVSLTTYLAIQFDKPIAFGDTVLIRLYETVGDVLVQEWDENDVLAIVPGGDSVEILPDELDVDKEYYITIASGSIESVDGVAYGGIADETTWNFSTSSGVPEAFVLADWDIEEGDEEASVTINSLPYDRGSAITDIDYRLDGGSWVSTGGTTSFTITGLTNDQEYDVELRAVNANGDGAAGDTKQVTPFAVGGWTPADLPNLLIWYDFSDLSTLFQTTDESTPVTTDAQTIGRVNDKSGNGYHLTQATSGSRPAYDVTSGVHSAEFDGTDDILFRTSAPIFAAGAFSAFAGVIAPSNSDRRLLGERSTSSSTPIYAILQGENGAGQHLTTWGRRQVDSVVWVDVETTSPDAFDSNPHVIGAVDSTTTVQHYVDGSAGSLSSTFTRPADTFDRLSLGGLMTATPTAWWAGKVQQVVVVSGVISAPNRALLEAYIAAKNGATV